MLCIQGRTYTNKPYLIARKNTCVHVLTHTHTRTHTHTHTHTHTVRWMVNVICACTAEEWADTPLKPSEHHMLVQTVPWLITAQQPGTFNKIWYFADHETSEFPLCLFTGQGCWHLSFTWIHRQVWWAQYDLFLQGCHYDPGQFSRTKPVFQQLMVTSYHLFFLAFSVNL